MACPERLRDLQERIRESGLTAALLFYSRDVLYYTGTAQPACLAVFPDGYTLFVRSGLAFTLEEALIPAERIVAERRLDRIRARLSARLKGAGKIGTELDILPAAQVRALQQEFGGLEFVDISPVVLEQRKRKDPAEIDSLRKACAALHAGHEAVLCTLREGVTELQLAAAVENAHRLAGHEGIFFIRQPDFFMSRGPLASGFNLTRISGVVYSISGVGLSPAVPAGPSRRRIAAGDPVVVDIPTLVEGYHADQTRTYCLGKPSGKIETMHGQLLEISDFLIERLAPGMRCDQVFQLAWERAKKMKVLGPFLNFGRGHTGRMIGHGVGLELNEPPILAAHDKTALPEGCVIALDMHMMDGEADAVKLEDMILVRESGNEILTRSPRQLFVV